MSFWKNLFKKGEEPVLEYNDTVLGKLTWNEDRESWDGIHNDIRFGVNYDYEKEPKEDVLAYARKVVLDDEWSIGALKRIKEIAIQEYSSDFHQEVNELTIKMLCFFDNERLHIQLYENDNEPWWFAEAINGEIKYVGFDT